MLDRQAPGQQHALVRRHLAPELGIVAVGLGIRGEPAGGRPGPNRRPFVVGHRANYDTGTCTRLNLAPPTRTAERARGAYADAIASTSSISIGIRGPRIRQPVSVTTTSSSTRMPPKPLNFSSAA